MLVRTIYQKDKTPKSPYSKLVIRNLKQYFQESDHLRPNSCPHRMLGKKTWAPFCGVCEWQEQNVPSVCVCAAQGESNGTGLPILTHHTITSFWPKNFIEDAHCRIGRQVPDCLACSGTRDSHDHRTKVADMAHRISSLKWKWNGHVSRRSDVWWRNGRW